MAGPDGRAGGIGDSPQDSILRGGPTEWQEEQYAQEAQRRLGPRETTKQEPLFNRDHRHLVYAQQRMKHALSWEDPSAVRGVLRMAKNMLGVTAYNIWDRSGGRFASNEAFRFFTETLDEGGLKFEAELVSQMFMSFFDAQHEPDFKTTDPNASMGSKLRHILFGTELPRVELTAGALFQQEFANSSRGRFGNSDWAKHYKETGAAQNPFLRYLEHHYAPQLLEKIQQDLMEAGSGKRDFSDAKTQALLQTESKTLLAVMASSLGQTVARHKIDAQGRVVMQDVDGQLVRYDLNNATDVGHFINRLVGKKYQVEVIVPQREQEQTQGEEAGPDGPENQGPDQEPDGPEAGPENQGPENEGPQAGPDTEPGGPHEDPGAGPVGVGPRVSPPQGGGGNEPGGAGSGTQDGGPSGSDSGAAGAHGDDPAPEVYRTDRITQLFDEAGITTEEFLQFVYPDCDVNLDPATMEVVVTDEDGVVNQTNSDGEEVTSLSYLEFFRMHREAAVQLMYAKETAQYINKLGAAAGMDAVEMADAMGAEKYDYDMRARTLVSHDGKQQVTAEEWFKTHPEAMQQFRKQVGQKVYEQMIRSGVELADIAGVVDMEGVTVDQDLDAVLMELESGMKSQHMADFLAEHPEKALLVVEAVRQKQHEKEMVVDHTQAVAQVRVERAEKRAEAEEGQEQGVFAQAKKLMDGIAGLVGGHKDAPGVLPNGDTPHSEHTRNGDERNR